MTEAFRNLEQVQIEGTWYLGVLDKKTFTVKNALQREKTLEGTICTWIQRKNLSTLGTIQFNENASYVSQPLSTDARVLLESEWARMQVIRVQALRRLENRYFREKQ